MIEKTEWEVVDDKPQRASEAFRARRDDEAEAPQDASSTTGSDPRRAAQAATAAMLGPWWKWKLSGVALLAVVVFAIIATMVGVAALALVALAIVGAGVRKLTLWMRGDRSTSIMRL